MKCYKQTYFSARLTLGVIKKADFALCRRVMSSEYDQRTFLQSELKPVEYEIFLASYLTKHSGCLTSVFNLQCISTFTFQGALRQCVQLRLEHRPLLLSSFRFPISRKWEKIIVFLCLKQTNVAFSECYATVKCFFLLQTDQSKLF